MARNLAHDQTHLEKWSTIYAFSDDSKKELLNRRECLQIGTAATAVVVGTGGLSAGVLADSDVESETYMTDFSEYATTESDSDE